MAFPPADHNGVDDNDSKDEEGNTKGKLYHGVIFLVRDIKCQRMPILYQIIIYIARFCGIMVINTRDTRRIPKNFGGSLRKFLGQRPKRALARCGYSEFTIKVEVRDGTIR
jgi:hypothetical protein